MLTCEAEVTEGETNHIKLAIADTSDDQWNAAVFLQTGSFVANVEPVVTDVAVPGTVTGPTPVRLPGSDADGDPLTYSVVEPPANGTLSGTGADLTYTPESGFAGTDSFTYRASDGKGESNLGTVTLTVEADAGPGAEATTTSTTTTTTSTTKPKGAGAKATTTTSTTKAKTEAGVKGGGAGAGATTSTTSTSIGTTTSTATTTTATDGPASADAHVSTRDTTADRAPTTLPLTGARTGLLAAAGVSLVVAGLVLLGLRRRPTAR